MSKNYCVNGECSRCGNCCVSYIPVTRKEVKVIKKYVEENNIQQEPIVKPEGIYIDKCPFFSKDHCTIYPVRPEVCRRYKCCHSKKVEESNKKYFYDNCYYNGKNGSFRPLQLLIYNDPTSLVLFCYNVFSCKTLKSFIKFCLDHMCEDVAMALITKNLNSWDPFPVFYVARNMCNCLEIEDMMNFLKMYSCTDILNAIEDGSISLIGEDND